MTTLSYSTIRKYFPGKNFMTPEIIEYGNSGNLVWELSKGTGLFTEQAIYGVTVKRTGYGLCTIDELDLSQCFESEEAARNHIKEL